MQLLESILGAKNSVKVVRHLAKHKVWDFNISELARDTGMNKGVLSRLIKKLEAENVIDVKRKGKIKLFCINKENLFIQQAIIPLFEKEESFFTKQLKKIVPQLMDKSTISIILYGSVAAGKAKLTSDIDLVILVSKKSKKIEETANKVKEDLLKKGFLLRIDIMSFQEFKKMHALKEPLIRSIWKNHKILYGKKLAEALK